jgi:hypothetical protein
MVNPNLERDDIGPDPQYKGLLSGLEGAVVDLYVLGAAADLVMSAGSTFSYVAQSLQGKPGVTVTRQGKCVRALGHSPMSGSFPDAADEACWSAKSMWGVAQDQLCADRLCPISCGGRFERAQGETTAWQQKVLRKQLDALSVAERQKREVAAKAMRKSKREAIKQRPDFWKE